MRKYNLKNLFKLNDKKLAKFIQKLDQDSFIKIFLEEKPNPMLNRLGPLLRDLTGHLKNQVAEYFINILDENTLIDLFKSGDPSIADYFFVNYYNQPFMMTLIDKVSSQGLLNICTIKMYSRGTVAHTLFYRNPFPFLAMKKKLNLKDLSQILLTQGKFYKDNRSLDLEPAVYELLRIPDLHQTLIETFNSDLWSNIIQKIHDEKNPVTTFMRDSLNKKTFSDLSNKLSYSTLFQLVSSKFIYQYLMNNEEFIRCLGANACDIRDFLNNPQENIKSKPEQFVKFISQRLQTWRGIDDALFQLKILQGALEIKQLDNSILDNLKGLIFKLCETVEKNISDITEISDEFLQDKDALVALYTLYNHFAFETKGEEKNKGKRLYSLNLIQKFILKSVSRVRLQQIHLQPAEWFTLGDSLILKEELDVPTSSTLVVNYCRFKKKGLECLTEGLLQTNEIKDETILGEMKNRFLAYLGLSPYEKEHISALESWLNIEKTKRSAQLAVAKTQPEAKEIKGLDDDNEDKETSPDHALIQNKLDELEVQANQPIFPIYSPTVEDTEMKVKETSPANQREIADLFEEEKQDRELLLLNGNSSDLDAKSIEEKSKENKRISLKTIAREVNSRQNMSFLQLPAYQKTLFILGRKIIELEQRRLSFWCIADSTRDNLKQKQIWLINLYRELKTYNDANQELAISLLNRVSGSPDINKYCYGLFGVSDNSLRCRHVAIVSIEEKPDTVRILKQAQGYLRNSF